MANSVITVKGTHNLVRYSNYDSGTTWSKIETTGTGTLTTGQTDPWGGTKAVRLTCNNDGNILLRLTSNPFINSASLGPGDYNISFYVKKVSGTGVAYTDLSDIAVQDYSSYLITGQWVRFSYTTTVVSSAVNLDLYSDANTNYVLDFAGVQVTRGTDLRSYLETNGTGIEAFGDGSYRVDDDYDLYCRNLRYSTLIKPNNAQGLEYGYHAGSTPFTTIVNRFSIVSDGNGVSAGNLANQRNNIAGAASQENGYMMGGSDGPVYSNMNDRFPFAAFPFSSTQLANLLTVRSGPMGQSSTTHGYASGGTAPGTPLVYYNQVERFPFASDTDTMTDLGNLAQSRHAGSGISSTTNGYSAGGYFSPPAVYQNIIDRFPFSSPFATATDVGNLSVSRATFAGTGCNSPTHGYTMGGTSPSVDTIDKFPFSSPFVTATDVGNLVAITYGIGASSSVTHGYGSGGQIPTGTTRDIQKYPFSSDTNSTDVGDLSRDHKQGGSTQH